MLCNQAQPFFQLQAAEAYPEGLLRLRRLWGCVPGLPWQQGGSRADGKESLLLSKKRVFFEPSIVICFFCWVLGGVWQIFMDFAWLW